MENWRINKEEEEFIINEVMPIFWRLVKLNRDKILDMHTPKLRVKTLSCNTLDTLNNKHYCDDVLSVLLLEIIFFNAGDRHHNNARFTKGSHPCKSRCLGDKIYYVLSFYLLDFCGFSKDIDGYKYILQPLMNILAVWKGIRTTCQYGL